MSVERKGEQIIIQTEKGVRSISPMVKTKGNFDENAFKAWQGECAKRLKPNARPASELPDYLTALYDLEVLNLQDDCFCVTLFRIISANN